MALIAFAMALAPFAMPIGQAMASAPMHHGDMAKANHCSGEPQQKPTGKSHKPCCVAGCVAVPMLTGPAVEQVVSVSSAATAAPQKFRRGFLGEIATPPPRIA